MIHDEEPLEAETDHHHKIDHEHATSHQSFKIHHFHAVPVYVKHEDQQFLKHPVEVGGIKHKLKVSVCLCFYRERVHFFSVTKSCAIIKFKIYIQVLHPKTEQHHSHGLTLENHTEGKDLIIHGYEQYDGSNNHQYETVENPQEIDSTLIGGQDLSRHQFQDITVHHGH